MSKSAYSYIGDIVSDSEDTDVWLRRLMDGDRDALARLFSYHRAKLRRMVQFRLDGRLRGRVDPSDVLQEAYLDASQRLGHYLAKPSVPLFVWLREITVQRLIDVHRQHVAALKRTVNQEVQMAENREFDNTSNSIAFQLVAHLTSPSQALQRIELMTRIRDALESMDALDREVIALRHFEELTNDEVADVLGLQKSAASNRYVRALSRLRGLLSQVPGLVDQLTKF